MDALTACDTPAYFLFVNAKKWIKTKNQSDSIQGRPCDRTKVQIGTNLFNFKLRIRGLGLVSKSLLQLWWSVLEKGKTLQRGNRGVSYVYLFNAQH